MSDEPRQKRAYNSTRRQAQARETRQKIIDAARMLFLQRGYAGATIEAMAQAAEVAPESIYAIFGSKRKILTHWLDTAVGGDDARIPLMKRPGPRAVHQETNQRRQLEMFAHGIADILERVSPIFEVMRGAAKTEPEIAELLRASLGGRWQNMSGLAGRIAENGPLREGVDANQAAHTIWTLTDPGVYALLTVERGWTKPQYVAWLADSLIRLLLP